MLVGHTHDDIDQMFSRFSKHLQRNDAPTVGELHARCKAAYTPEPSTEYLEEVVDWCGWFDEHRTRLHGQSQPHQFRFTLQDGFVVIHAKEFSDGEYGQAVSPLKTMPDDYKTEPAVLQHNQLELDELRTTVEELRKYMTEAQVEEWEQFQTMERARARPPYSTTWRAFTQKLVASVRVQAEQSTTSTALIPSPFTCSAAALSGTAVSVAASAVQTPRSAPRPSPSPRGFSSDALEEISAVVVEAESRPLLYCGPRRKKGNEDPLEVGDYVALASDGSDGLPFWIAKVNKILSSGIEVTWHGCTKLDGTGKWFPQQKANTSQWYTGIVQPESVLLFGFRMTKSKHLYKKAYTKVLSLCPSGCAAVALNAGPHVSV